jgi:hypothetical protein
LSGSEVLLDLFLGGNDYFQITFYDRLTGNGKSALHVLLGEPHRAPAADLPGGYLNGTLSTAPLAAAGLIDLDPRLGGRISDHGASWHLDGFLSNIKLDNMICCHALPAHLQIIKTKGRAFTAERKPYLLL